MLAQAMTIYWLIVLGSLVLSLTMLWQLRQLYVTLRLYRRVFLTDAIRTLVHAFSTRNGWVLILPLLSAFLFGLILPQRSASYPSALLLLVVLLHLNVFALYATPPSVLLLGSSRWETVRLFNLIERGLYPYRVVVLLEPSQTQPIRHSPFHWFTFQVDNMRLLRPADWRDFVFRVSDTVPIIVLDTRLASPAVVGETQHMIQDPYRHKTLFVVQDDGTAPSLAALEIQLPLSEYRTAPMHDVVDALKHMGLIDTASPDDNPVLAKASYASHSMRLERA